MGNKCAKTIFAEAAALKNNYLMKSSPLYWGKKQLLQGQKCIVIINNLVIILTICIGSPNQHRNMSTCAHF
jgi:hypothetical protein